MKTLKILLSLGLLIAVSAGCSGSGEDENPSDNENEIEFVQSEKQRSVSPAITQAELDELVAGNTEFAFNLYQAVSSRSQSENLFISPYSISLALVMAYAGAKRETEQQIADTLGFTLPQKQIHAGFNALDLELATRGSGASGKDGKGFRLNIANSAWGQKGYGFLSSFLDVLAENYEAGMNLLDFMTMPEDSRLTINEWISNKTELKINNLLPQGSVTSSTRLILTNAIYFNAAWEFPFDEEYTADGTFHLSDGSSITVPMMFQSQFFEHMEGENYHAVDMLYDGEELSMVLVIPEMGKFREVEALLTANLWETISENFTSKKIKFTMPKFNYESNAVSLKETLSDMGMYVAFSADADFSGINGGRDISLGNVFHKTFVSVDEAGTEAAAATSGGTGGTGEPSLTLVIDRPFIFFIRDIQTEVILFMGRLMNPA